MFSHEERKIYFDNMVEKIESSERVEGIVQIGSGVIGFSDEHSDIDLMVANYNVEDAETTKNVVHEFIKSNLY